MTFLQHFADFVKNRLEKLEVNGFDHGSTRVDPVKVSYFVDIEHGQHFELEGTGVDDQCKFVVI